MIKKIQLNRKTPDNIFKSYEYHEPVKKLDSSDDLGFTAQEVPVKSAEPLLEEPTTQMIVEPIKANGFSVEQQIAIDYFIRGENIFLTGPGGTGKTFLIKEFIKEAFILNKKIQVCALTGCASVY